MSKLSVIVPIYGVEKYLRECLDSIVSQTLTDIEIILVDDGGKDSCPAICDEYAQKDSRIKVIHKENGGYGHTCNVGLSVAQGEYISIIEPDDYIDSKMFEDLYNIAQANDSDIVKSNFYDNLQLNGLLNPKKVEWDVEKIPTGSFTIKECPLFLYYHPSIWSCIYKREFLNKHNIRFVEAPGAGWTDNPFQVQTLCLAERINYTDNAYYYWRRLNEDASDDLKDWTLPYKRSDEIHQWLDENHITDDGILACLYMREIVYIFISLGSVKFKQFNEIKPLIEKMLDRMDADILNKNAFVKKRAIREYKKLKNNLLSMFLKIKFKKNRKKMLSIRFNSREKRIRILGKQYIWGVCIDA